MKVYSSSNPVWNATSLMPEQNGLESHALAVSGDKAFVAGGISGGTRVASAASYDRCVVPSSLIVYCEHVFC